MALCEVEKKFGWNFDNIPKELLDYNTELHHSQTSHE